MGGEKEILHLDGSHFNESNSPLYLLPSEVATNLNVMVFVYFPWVLVPVPPYLSQ